MQGSSGSKAINVTSLATSNAFEDEQDGIVVAGENISIVNPRFNNNRFGINLITNTGYGVGAQCDIVNIDADNCRQSLLATDSTGTTLIGGRVKNSIERGITLGPNQKSLQRKVFCKR